ncbi:dehydrogenase/reductase SDR family member 11-like isoform X2 [Aphis craccivora]|uniref:Dehydrogenase/reductase SDR family member 11-like isoform X2 n=1 Tax=Aphis craccivora TaxID=307492 RepID=A0A6G0ZLH6_APHCR|nr:dehydrogenase/reductase SDR family member 11-like isoform X2 [Aphis craccivora]
MLKSFVRILNNNKASDCQSIIFKSVHKCPPVEIGDITLLQLYTRNQFGVCLLSLIPLDEVVHVEQLLREIGNLISYGSSQEYKRGKVTPIDVNVNYLAVCIIQNFMETFHI